MLSHKENFPTASENSNNVSILIVPSCKSHLLLSSKKFIEALYFGVFVNEDNLPAILDHAMARIAEKGKDSLMWIDFK